MFGCFRTVGCLAVAAVVAVGAFVTRDMWLPRITGVRPDAGVQWERVTDDRRERARNEVRSLGNPTGPVYTTLSAAEVSALVLDEAQRRYPTAIQGGEAAVEGDQLKVRATVNFAEIRGLDGLGPITQMLGGRQQVALSGTLGILRPGVAEFRVKEAKIGELIIPAQAIPRLVAQLSKGEREPGAAPDGIPFPVPPHIGDVRVDKGRVTLYKSTQ